MDQRITEVVTAAARAAIARQTDDKNLVIVDMRWTDHPLTGEPIARVLLSSPADPNTIHHAVLNTKGEAVDIDPGVFVTIKDDAPLVPPKGRINISPETNDFSLSDCDEFSERITVTIPKSDVVPKADVYFLADTTSSMSPVIGAVISGAGTILSSLAGLGLDLAFGVGNYRDFPDDPFAFQHQQNPTTVTADAAAAIGAWTVAGGNDLPEGQLFALDQLAQPPGGTIGWRAGAKRIIVWFGDAPGHDPVCAAISGLGVDITEASATAKLVAEAITVLAISTDTGVPNALDADPVPLSFNYAAACGAPGGAPGQATRITAATGGSHVSGISAATIVSTIVTLVGSAVATINNVNLVPTGATAGFVSSITPAGGFGPLPLDRDHTLTFVVVWKGGAVPCGDKAQEFTGTLDVVADGVVVAQKKVRITIPPCRYAYTVKFVCGVQAEEDRRCTPVLPGIYATEINIHNPTCRAVEVEKRVIPLVIAGRVGGREPESVGVKAVDRIKLPPESATMDDCCRIEELLFGASGSSPMPITIGFLEILSPVELNVTAVYTASNLKGESLTMDVETISAKRK